VELFFTILEAVYHLGTDVLFGHSEKPSMLRMVVIGGCVGWLGIAPVTIAVFLWALYCWLFALWHPSLREISGFYFGGTVVLGSVLCIVWLAQHVHV
jgi:hypothetical protein